MSSVQTSAEMGRPKAEKPKTAVISSRTFLEVREAIDAYARLERRTTAQMIDLLLREAIIARRKKDKLSTIDIERLP